MALSPCCAACRPPDVDILEIADISQLTAQLSRHRPDVLVVNPASLGFCTPQQLRVQTGCEGLRCIALQMSVTDAATLNAYDDVLSVYDPVETLREKDHATGRRCSP